MIRGEEYIQKVDIFSFGCMLRELAEGMPPFSEYPPLKVIKHIAILKRKIVSIILFLLFLDLVSIGHNGSTTIEKRRQAVELYVY